jgi:hypothetical protein
VSHSPSYVHLSALSDRNGVFEHALHDRPRLEHGYCVDDVARALIVVVREPDQTPALAALTETYLRFLEAALSEHGRSHNRMRASGDWTDSPGLGDWWGRSVWALGIASQRAQDPEGRRRALRAFHRAAKARSPFMHAMVFAALGAIEVLLGDPGDEAARSLLIAAVDAVPASDDPSWPWPEDRLRYANGSVVDAVLGAGVALEDPSILNRGLDLLDFLLRLETSGDRLSVTGSRGRGRGERGPLFDQQPIEVAAIVDACVRAFEATGDPRWLASVRMGWAWFEGDNDSGAVMFDEVTGAGYDGLESSGRNENRGAESTLAALACYQQARRLEQLPIVAGAS